MKVGLVRRGYSASGGAESYLKRFAEALRAAGHECVLFASEEWPRGDWTHGDLHTLPRGSSPRAFADALAALDPRSKCDWLFSLERVWSCDCYRAGDGVHRAWLDRRQRFEPAWRAWLRPWANRKHAELLELETQLFSPEAKNRRFIANSRLVKNEIVDYFGLPPERITVIYNGVPLPPRTSESTAAAALRHDTRQRLGLDRETYVLLFAGSGWERKGLRFAIAGVEAIRSDPPPTLLVAGRGNPRSAGRRSSRVRLLGPVPGREMPGLLAAADVFLLPTIYDPFSNACLEALAAGLPVITTESNGFSEIIEPGVEGEVIADPADTGDIATAIERWRDPVKRAAFRPRLEGLAAKFSIEANLEKTLALVSRHQPKRTASSSST